MSYIGNMSDADFESKIGQAKQQQARIQHIVKNVFKSGVHYGSATGGAHGSKPTLLKPGADDAITMFDLKPAVEVKESFGDGDAQPSYAATVVMTLNDANGITVSVAAASANTSEKRNAKAIKNGANAFDYQNNTLKYAEKRATVAAVLKLGFSAFFTQDLEDILPGTPGAVSDDPFGLDTPKVVETKPLPALPDPFAAVVPLRNDARVEPKPGSDTDLFGAVVPVIDTPSGYLSPAEAAFAPVKSQPGSWPIELTGNVILDINNVAVFIAGRTGETPKKAIFDASAFKADDGKTIGRDDPNRLTSDKWKKSTLSKLVKRAEGLKIAEHAPSEPTF